MYIDTHAHLNFPEIINNIDDVLDRAKFSGIEYIIVPATNYISSLEVIELVQKHDMLYAAIGIHPTELISFRENQLNEIDNLAKSEKVVAIGEIGLDYYWKPFDSKLQEYVLRSQIQIARDNNIPVIMHNRDSSEDLMNIVKEEYERNKFKGQFHSFSGDNVIADKCVEMGFYISFTGNITYKPNQRTFTAYESLKATPFENLLLETDSPYLPPVPFRGKINEPSYLIHTIKKISELKGVSIEELEEKTTSNAKNLYNFE